jgi:hypothetical protein
VVTAVVAESPAEPRRVHRDDWSYPGCPHSGPAIATGTDGATHVVWYNGKPGEAGVYYARAGSDGSSADRVGLVTGPKMGTVHPAVASLSRGGALAAYDLTAQGEPRIGVARLSPDGSVSGRTTIPGSDGGKYPQVVVMGDTAAVVAWTEATGTGPRVQLARLDLR